MAENPEKMETPEDAEDSYEEIIIPEKTTAPKKEDAPKTAETAKKEDTPKKVEKASPKKNQDAAPKKSVSDRFHGKMEHYYDTHYKILAIIPFIIGILALLVIFIHYQQTGDFMDRGISLKGGTTFVVSVDKELDPDALTAIFTKAFPGKEFNIRALKDQGVTTSISIETSLTDTSIVQELLPIIEKELGHPIAKNDYSINTIGSSLSESFFQEMVKILLLAFLLMGIVVLITFRSPIPSFYVMICAVFDMIITLAVVDIFGIKVTTAGVAAFIMLISFSIDSDILLTARILPKELHGQRTPGTTPYQGFVSAFMTDMTLTATTFAAVLVAFLLSNSPDIKQIMVITMIGQIVDVVVTWLQNASLCRWYVDIYESKRK